MARRYLQALLLLAACEAYAVLRYVVVGATPAAHVPAFVTNKAISMAALGLLGVAVASRHGDVRRFAGLAGFALTGLHVVLSLTVLSPAYLPGFFRAPPGSGFTAAAEFGLLLGAAALVLLAVVAWPRGGRGPSLFAGRTGGGAGILLGLVGLHCLAFGSKGWATPSGWPGKLPPITLLSFLYVVGALAAGLRRGRTRRTPPA